MKIVHIVEDYSILSGGIRTVVKNLHLQLLSKNHKSVVIAPFSEDGDEDVVNVPINRSAPWFYSKSIKRILEELHGVNKIDIIHIHGVWMYPQYFGSKFAIKHNIPFVVSFHGMYEPWLWKSGYIKKTIYSKFITNRLFSKAAILHSITNSETNDLKNRFNKSKVIEIPNLISVDTIQQTVPLKKCHDYILFLGRLDPIKGINILIDAFVEIKDNYKVRLKIAGPANDYQTQLKRQVEESSISDKVEFLGVVTGIEKQILFENALVFVSPSFSEVIGMVNLEAALFGSVVIASKSTGLNMEWNNNGGFLVNSNVKEVKEAIETVLNWDDETRRIKEDRLKEYVKKEYSWQAKYSLWENLYNSIL